MNFNSYKSTIALSSEPSTSSAPTQGPTLPTQSALSPSSSKNLELNTTKLQWKYSDTWKAPRTSFSPSLLLTISTIPWQCTQTPTGKTARTRDVPTLVSFASFSDAPFPGNPKSSPQSHYLPQKRSKRLSLKPLLKLFGSEHSSLPSLIYLSTSLLSSLRTIVAPLI